MNPIRRSLRKPLAYLRCVSQRPASGRSRREASPLAIAGLLAMFALAPLRAAMAQDEAPLELNQNKPPVPVLADKQNQVTDRYRKLEELLLRLADVEADENPERAALLRRAARQSRDTFVLEKLVAASDSLKAEQYAKALESQSAAKEGLDKLLTLLLSEDRPQRIRDEKKRIANMIKELKVVERLQRSTRARTENGADLEDVAGEQAKIGERSEKVRDELKDEEASEESPAAEGESSEGKEPKDGEGNESEAKPSKGSESKDGEPKDGQTKDGQPKDGEPKDGEPKDDEPKDGESAEEPMKADDEKPTDKPADEPESGEPSDSDSKPSDSESQPSESQPSESQPSQSQPGGESQPGEQGEQQPQQPQQPQSPEQQAEKQLNEAIKQMREAEKQLEEAKRDSAVEKQKEAEENLRAAIDRLEKILRQLREEEMQRELARLESRLRKMAQMQGKVLDDTKTLAAVPEAQRDRQIDLRAGNLAFEEKKIVLEADRAMLLLREEGSSVAFPEVMAQVRSDMQRVAERLTATKIDVVTVGIQEDVLAALEEMIAALQQAQRDLEKQQQQQQQQGEQQGGGEQGEQPLVEQIAELKLIRTMETRIKSTTERYAELIGQEPAGSSDVLPLLRDLSERQSNLYRVTRDLVLKRNK